MGGVEAGTADLGNIQRHKAHLELALVKDREVRKCFCRYVRERKSRETWLGCWVGLLG